MCLDFVLERQRSFLFRIFIIVLTIRHFHTIFSLDIRYFYIYSFGLTVIYALFWLSDTSMCNLFGCQRFLCCLSLSETVTHHMAPSDIHTLAAKNIHTLAAGDIHTHFGNQRHSYSLWLLENFILPLANRDIHTPFGFQINSYSLWLTETFILPLAIREIHTPFGHQRHSYSLWLSEKFIPPLDIRDNHAHTL